MSEQVTIDSLEFARQGRCLQGEIAVAGLDSLREHLHASAGTLQYTLIGMLGGNGKPRLVLSVNGELTLVCQRCLGPLAFPLAIEATLEPVKGGDSFLPLEGEDDLIDIVPADAAMDVQALVEEEVLLSLPIAPVHDLAECAAAERLRKLAPGKSNPFEVLAALKKGR